MENLILLSFTNVSNFFLPMYLYIFNIYMCIHMYICVYMCVHNCVYMSIYLSINAV